MDTGSTVNSILSDIKSLSDVHNLNGNILSETALRLSTNKAYIGQATAKMQYEYDMMEAMRKQEWNRVFSEARKSTDKTTIKDCEILADNEVKTIVKDGIELDRKLNVLKNLRRDVESVITTIQTRISQIKSEFIESKS